MKRPGRTVAEDIRWFLRLTPGQKAYWYWYAMATINHCEQQNPELEAVQAGFFAGAMFAAEMIGDRIRAELVCCPSEHIDAMQQLMRERDGKPMSALHEFHPICYWGEMAARLADDGHSLMKDPYNCDGKHPGDCWRGREDGGSV